MLVLRFEIGGQPFAMDVAYVGEVVPQAELRPLPGAPPWASGLLHYRQEVVPVVDLGAYAGQPVASSAWSTRILVLRAHEQRRAIGLLANRVTDVEKVDPAALRDLPMRLHNAPWVGRVYTSTANQQMVCLIEPNKLLPDDVQAALWSAVEDA